MGQNNMFNDEIDLLELFQKLYERKWIILWITAFTTALAILVSIFMPKVYKAEAVVEVPVIQDSEIIDIVEIQESIKIYKDNTLKDVLKKVRISPIGNSQNMAKIEVEGISPQVAKENLVKVLEIINKKLFPQKIEEVKKKYERRLDYINQAILNMNSGKHLVLDPSKVVDLLTEKEQIQEWLQDPKFVILASDIQASSRPVRPKPLLYTSVGFITGIFLGIFVVLILEAIKSRKMNINHLRGQ